LAGLRPPVRNADPALPSHSHPDTDHPDCLDELTATHSAQHTIAEMLLLEFGMLPLHLQQACQFISLHYRYTISHTHLIAAHLYRILRQFRLSNCHPRQSIEIRMEDAYNFLAIKGMYTNPYTPSQVAQAKVRNENASHLPISSNLLPAQYGIKI